MKDREYNPSSREIQRAMAANASGNYTGQGDLNLDFGTSTSFADEVQSNREFTFGLTNTGLQDVTVALNPASYTAVADILDANGLAVDAILKEGSVIDNGDTKKLTAKGRPKSILDWMNFVKNHPTRVHTMKFQVSKEEALANPVYWKRITPFSGGGAFEQFTPSLFTDENTQQANRATCDLQAMNFQFDEDTVVVYTIPAGATIQITMLIGAISNDCLELERKAQFGRIGALNS